MVPSVHFTSLDRPHQAEVRWLPPPSPCCTVQEELHRPVRLAARELHQRRTPARHSVSDDLGLLEGQGWLTKFGLPTSFLASHKNGFSKL